MKKRNLLLSIFVLAMSVCLLLALVGCSNNEQCSHEWQDETVISAPTCTNAGTTEQKCVKCDEKRTVEISALGHDMQTVPAKGTSCIESGYSQYEQCSRCDYNTKVVIPALEHNADLSAWLVDGSKHYHACTNEKCTAKLDETNHVDSDRDHTCDDCLASVSACVDDNNDHVCDYCEAPVSTCTGGTATCKSKAVCSICGNEYGDFDSTNHEEDLVWTKTATKHKRAYECCGAVTVDEEAHDWEDGVCTVCGDYDTYGTDGIYYEYDSQKETYYIDYYYGDSAEVSIARYQYDENTGLKPVTYIRQSAFSSKSITKVVIPNTVSRIEANAFNYSQSLEEIVFPDTIEYIGSYAFDGVPAITSYVNAQPDGDVYIGKVLYTYKGTMPENYTLNVKEGTTSISAMAYKEQGYLIAINMPSSLKEIGFETFESCHGLTEITLGENVILIEECAFEECSDVETITFNSKVEVIESHAFASCNSIRSLTIPENVTTIGEFAFGYMNALESVTIEGAGLTSLDDSFNACEELTSITFDISLETLKEISDDVWCGNCPKLTVNYNGGSFKVHYDKVDATCTEDGSVAYWYNFIDGKKYSGKYFSPSTLIENVVIPAIGHNPSIVNATATEIEHYHCSNCGGNFSDETCTNPLSSISAE